MVLEAGLIATVSATLLLFEAPFSAGWFALLALWSASHLAPSGWGVRIGRWLVMGVLLVAAFLAWRTLPGEVGGSMDRWQARLDRGEPLHLHQRVAVFGMHGAMFPVGLLLGFPEAAWEVLALHTGGGPYTWEGDVVLRDPVGRRHVRRWADDVARGATGPFGPVRVTWSGAYHHDRDRSLRAGLALNCPLELRGERIDEGDGPALRVSATCPVRWRRASIAITRIGDQTLFLHEGLFVDLQRANWITSVHVTWTTIVRANDPRLDGEAVTRGWVERAMVEGSR